MLDGENMLNYSSEESQNVNLNAVKDASYNDTIIQILACDKLSEEEKIQKICSAILGSRIVNGKLVPLIIETFAEENESLININFSKEKMLEDVPALYNSNVYYMILNQTFQIMLKNDAVFNSIIEEKVYLQALKVYYGSFLYNTPNELFISLRNKLGTTSKASMENYVKTLDNNEKILNDLNLFFAANDKSEEELKEELSDEVIKSGNKEFKYRSYKELNSLAEKKSYVFDRQNGDHAIFVKDNGEIVVIPQGREIGKGLQIKILKTLEDKLN